MLEATLNFPLAVLDSFLNVAVVILGIGLLIFVHELGHFLVAKWNKVRVEAFSLGFGPVLWGFKRGDTHYRLSAIPLGGYVKMAGETPSDDHTEDPGEFQNKSILARTAILSAGVVMNAIVGILLFIVAFNIGVPLPSPKVGYVIPGYPAWSAGIRPGDKIISIGGTRTLDFNDVISEAAFSTGPVDVVVLRNGEEITFPGIVAKEDAQRGIRRIGVGMAVEPAIRVEEDSAAYQSGLRSGDELIQVGDASGADLVSVERVLEQSPAPVPVTVRRGDETLSIELMPKTAPAEDSRLIIGIAPLVGRIAEVRPGSDAEAAGFLAKDEFLAVGGEPALGFRSARRLAAARPGANVVFTVRRGDSSVDIPVGVRTPTEWDRFFMDLSPEIGNLNTTIVSLVPDDQFEQGNPARAAGLVEGAKITRVNGQAVQTFEDIVAGIGDTDEGEAIGIHFSVGDVETGPVEVHRRRQVTREYGIVWATATETVRVEGIPAACAAGLRRSVQKGREILQMLAGIFSGRVSAKNLGGPVAIFRISYDAAQRNFMHFLYFLGILSINLAILNILPIPVLDGGHLFFILIEAIRRKPLPEKAMALFQWAGFLFLILVMVFVFANDIIREVS